MPKFEKLSEEQVQELSRRKTNIEDLGEYLSYLKELNVGDWGSIELAQDESSRTVKRRTSIAASSQGKKIHWRPGRGRNDSTLVFQVKESAAATKAPSAPRRR